MRGIAASLVLVAVNLAVCWELFFIEYTKHMSAIDGGHITVARWYLEHGGELGWFPLWYTGVPVVNAYQPLSPAAVALVAWVFSISPALAYHGFTALMYVLGPLAVFWLAGSLSNERGLSFMAALIYSLFSFSVVLVPEIGADMETPFGPRRLFSLVHYGDGPHVAALTLLPIAVLAFHAAMIRQSVARILFAAIAMATVVLANWIGAVALAMAVGGYLLAIFDRAWIRQAVTAVGIATISYGLVFHWMPPSKIAVISRNSRTLAGTFPMTWKQYVALGLLAVAAVALAILLRRFRAPLALRFGVLFLLVSGVVTVSHYWAGPYLLPQSYRYHLEAEMAAAFAVVFGAGFFVKKWQPRWRKVMVALLSVLALIQLVNYRLFARTLVEPIAIEETVEYAAANWLEANVPDGRVYAAGSIQYWLNAFTNVQQVGGAAAQGTVNPTIAALHFGIRFTEDDGERSAMWLRTYGVDAIVASGAQTRDSYRAFIDAGKFGSVLEERWRDGDDVIYVVPRRSRSLAHVIGADDVPPRAPYNVVDTEPVEAYHAALEDVSLPVAHFAWQGPNRAVITAEMGATQVVSVQIAYHPGWRARVNEKAVPIRTDGLGFMVIDPGCLGECAIQLSYEG